MMFVVETLLLGAVVDLWNLHWLPLVVVFIDWEALLARVRRTPVETVATPAGWRAPRATRVFIIAFVVYDVLTAFVPTLDQRLNTYPFSSFPMFAAIRAREPYSEHLPYSVVGGTYEVISDVPVDPNAQRWLDHNHRNVWSVRNPDELHRRLTTVLERMQYYYPNYHVRGIRLWLTVFETAAYPASAKFEKHPIALVAELLPDGTFRTMLGTLSLAGEQAHLEVRPRNIELARDARLFYFRDDLPTGIPVTVPLAGQHFDLAYQRLPGNPRYFVVVSDNVPWLVARHESWRWR
jgi:hypothetical protein